MSGRRRCCVVSCSFSTKCINDGVRLYGLPKDVEQRARWCQWIADQNKCSSGTINQKKIFVCSSHFSEEQKGSRKLKAGAVPSISVRNNHSENANYHEVFQQCEAQVLQGDSCTEKQESQQQEQRNECVDIQAIGMQQPNHCEVSNSFQYSSIVEINMQPNQDDVHLSLAESDKEQARLSCDTEEVVCIDHTTASDHTAEGHLEVDNVFYLLKNDTCDTEEVVCIDQTTASDHTAEGHLEVDNVFYLLKNDNLLPSVLENNTVARDCLEQARILSSTETVFVIEETNDSALSVEKSLGQDSNSNVLYILNEENCQFGFTDNNIQVETQSLHGDNAETNPALYTTSETNTSDLSAEERQDNDSNVLFILNEENCQFGFTDHNVQVPPNEHQLPLFQDESQATTKNVNSDVCNVQSTNSRKCWAKDCSSQGSKTTHTFPAIIINGQINERNLNRCKLWIKNSANSKLLDVCSSRLHGHYGLCSSHFDDSQYYNSQTRKRLLPNAIPTLNLGTPIPDADMAMYPKWGPHDIFSDVTLNTENADNDRTVNTTAENGEPENNRPDLNELCAGIDELQKSFEEEMNTLEWRTCNVCKETFFTKKKSKKKCCHSKPICLALSDANGFDPGDVPIELQNLSPIEEQLISIIHPVIQVCKVKGHQFSYKGNIINFPQDVKSFATKLPHNIHDLKSTIKIRTTKAAANYKDFHVRADVVRKALIWLQANNPYYFDIHISEDNINLLPDDGNVYEQMPGVDVDEDENEDETFDDNDTVTESNVPMFSLPNEQEQIANVINWPTIGKKPIDEFNSDGYIVKAFPTLFPKGVCDISNARRKNVSDTNYFQHLMRYHDGRFAQHNRFRFFALNSLMRWNALNDGNVFIKRHPQFKNMSVKDLQDKLDEDPSLIKKNMFQGSNIRGTKAFWHAKGKELQAMIEQMGLATLFITLSAADMHWPELYKLLAPDEDVETMTQYRRMQLIQRNPLIVDEFFLTRAETFLQEVLTPKYKIKDLWFRIEYQHRGSPHLHGLLWLKDAPDVSNIANASEEEKSEVVKYFDELISTMHTNINEAPAQIHPCRKKLSEIVNLKQDLSQLLNCAQRHTVCTPGYCLKGNPPKCRFNFPAPLQEISKLDCSDVNNIQLITARNDSRLNKYNSYVIQTWRGNIDVSPILSKKKLINYLAKYVSKSETRSQTLIDLMKLVISNSDKDKPAKHAIQRMFIKTCSERDYSAQETSHILMGLKLVCRGARKFVSINFNEASQWQPVRKNGQSKTLPILELYKTRSDDQNNICLWTMAKFHKVNNPEKFNIIMVYPTAKLRASSQDNEQFYKQQCLLYIPWRNEEDLQSDKSWEEVYNDNLLLIKENQGNIMCLSGEPDKDAEYDEYEQEVLGREQWMAVSRMGPNQQLEDIQLGFRETDMNKNWHESLAKYQDIGGIPYLQSFLNNAKRDYETNPTLSSQFQFNLTPEQATVVELAQLQILRCQNELPHHVDPASIPKTVMVQGKAGTGKSVIASEIVKLVQAKYGQGSIVVLGPTGVSAVNVNGSTIQSKLKITRRNKNDKSDDFVPLKGQAAHDLAQEFENVKFVIMDEFSMIGCSMLSKIDKRLRQATGNSNEAFGGLNVYLFGDIKQLSPVADCAAYSTTQTSVETIRGKQLYDNMDAAFILSKIHRQNDSSFLEVLNNIGVGKVTRTDYDLLSTRFCTAVPCNELRQFRNSLHLFPTTDRVRQYNQDALETLQNKETHEPVPVACVPANHNTPAASKGTISDADGLEPVLYLAQGAKVMLRINLWTESGLVNGAMGEIDDIVYSEDAHPSHDPPSVLICKFPSYKGPYLDPVKKTVPIIALTKSWVNPDGINCSREQFPLTLAYATTIHKSQGLTLEKAYVDIGSKEMSPGLTYVALSRVKSLSGLLLAPFSYKRLKDLAKSTALKKRIAWESLLEQKQLFT